MALDNPEEFVSHIPCAQDGSVNGCQHLSMMGRDQTGALATNCTANDERFDLYMEVADAVMVILKRDAERCAVSAEWFKRLEGDTAKSRKVVKRAVMTTPYGVTDKGIATQLVNDKHCNDFTSASRIDASLVMTNAILESMSKVNGKGVKIMEYFQAVAVVLANQGLPLTWYTPMGLKVTQGYYKTQRREINTVMGLVYLRIEDADLGLDASKQALSSAPNVIHSFDAAMLQMTVSRLAEKGLNDFAMIHDSYGVHACDTETLNTVLRECALDIYSTDVLGDFHAYAQSQTSVVLPTPPELGEYDINEITNAPYFFS
jgi:DNA-directed RNA polymerase